MTRLSDYTKEELEAYDNLRDRICELRPECHRNRDNCTDTPCLNLIEDLALHIIRKDRPILRKSDWR
ncbi:MAG: hypothetical protein WC374_07565 [Phycisphaerae bacterium]|jgi:hypothetical protein